MTSRWVKQTRTHDLDSGVRGDCARADVASLLALSLEAVPDFDTSDALAYHNGLEGFFASLGYELYRIDRDVAFDSLHLAAGPSPRGVSHMVVRRGSEIVHDPHPQGGGISPVERVWVPIPLDPSGRLVPAKLNGDMMAACLHQMGHRFDEWDADDLWAALLNAAPTTPDPTATVPQGVGQRGDRG